MLDETPAQLVAHLSHPNGWWRDTAQQLLVLKQDKSVVPALQTIVRTSKNLLARFHALWTLEGLGALDAALTRELLGDRGSAHADSGDCAPARRFTRPATDRSTPIIARCRTTRTSTSSIQAMLTMNVLKVADAPASIKAAMDSKHGARRAVRRRTGF